MALYRAGVVFSSNSFCTLTIQPNPRYHNKNTTMNFIALIDCETVTFVGVILSTSHFRIFYGIRSSTSEQTLAFLSVLLYKHTSMIEWKRSVALLFIQISCDDDDVAMVVEDVFHVSPETPERNW